MSRFEEAPEFDNRDKLHVCPKDDCGNDLVQVADWDELVEEHLWWVMCHCPDCGWQGEGIHYDDKVQDFNEVLELGDAMLKGKVKILEANDFRIYAENFAAALTMDLIVPEDF